MTVSEKAETLILDSLAALAASDAPDQATVCTEIKAYHRLGLFSADYCAALINQAVAIAKARRKELRDARNRETVRRVTGNGAGYSYGADSKTYRIGDAE